MRKKMLSVLVFFLLIGTVPVQAQMFGHGSEVDRLVRSNQRMVSRFSYGGGGYNCGGYSYGCYNRRRHHHNHNDIWLGLGLGALTGALVYGALNNNRDDNQAVQPSSTPSYGDNSDNDSRENGWNSRLREQSNSVSGDSWFNRRSNCRERWMFTLKNESGEVIRVYKDGQPYSVIRPNRSTCGDPFAEYEAEAVSAFSDCYTARAHIVRAKPEGQSGCVWVWQ
mgnify:FL=1